MTRSQLVIEIFRMLGVVALAACALFVLLIWGADTIGLESVSRAVQSALDVAVIALVASAGLLIVVGIPLWLFPKLRRARG